MLSDLTSRLFHPADLTPHGFCLVWDPWLVWTHALANIAIGLAYFSIPVALLVFARRRRDLVFRPMFWMFAAFILLCGAGHWLDLLTLWVPAYRAEAIVKALTAVVSVVTAAALWPLLPKAVALPSPAQMRAANAALRDSEARHRTGFVHAPLPLHILDSAGCIVEVSNRWLALMGYGSRDDVVGRPIHEFQEDGGAATQVGLKRLLAEGVMEDVPRRFVRRDGVVLDVLVSAHAERAAHGAPVSLVVSVADVTARRRAEAALAESERNFRLLVEGVTDHAIYMISPAGMVASWNPGAERITGYSVLEAVGLHLSHFYTENDKAAGRPDTALAAAEREGRHEDEGWRVRKDGSRFWASAVIHAVRDTTGALVGFAKITRDVTERREALRALDATREQLAHAQKMEAMGRLTGGVAHDFNNMLQAVTGNLELIRSRVRGDRPDVARLAGNALDATAKAAGLTAQLLAFARRQPLDPRPLDAAEVVSSLRTLLARTLGERIALRVEAAPGGATCLADRNQLEAALLNLVINARDAISDGAGGGDVVVSTRLACVSTTSEGWPPAGEYVRIAVRDDGPGMTEDVRRRVFEPFFTTKAPGKGTGLGLAQIHGFAHQSGGTVLVESAPGCGTEVAILLPASREPPHRSTGVAVGEPEPEAGFGETILVVEDDPLVRGALVAAVQDLHYRVAEAADADAALAQIDAGLIPDAVLSDVSMPGSMDGLDLASALRQRMPGLPIVLATGRPETLSGGTPAGVEVLHKPLGRVRIAAAIRAALSGAQEPGAGSATRETVGELAV